MTVAAQDTRVSPVSLVPLAVGSLCVVVGAVTVFAPKRVEAASQRAFPDVEGDETQWRAVGFLTAGVGLLLATSV